MRTRILCLWITVVASFVIGGHQPSSSEPERPPDPFLAELEERVSESYRQAARLSFEVEVNRQVKDENQQIDYLIRVEMSPGKTKVEMFDEGRLAFRLNKTISPTSMVTTQEEYSTGGYDFQADTCLSGSLQKSWVGPVPPADPPPYTYRIRDGTYLGLTDDRGHQVRFQGNGVIQDYSIDPQTYLLVEWNSTFHEQGSGDPWMVVTRKYRYPERPFNEVSPISLSATQGVKK